MSPPSFFKDSVPLPTLSSLPQQPRSAVQIPPSSSKCPFSIRLLGSSTHLVREHDKYGEYPNIYVKLCRTATPTAPAPIGPGPYKYVLVLSDTGCGTEIPNPAFNPNDASYGPFKWNLRTFLEFTLNPGGKIPYLVMTTHCHYDHILGIGFLPPTCGQKCSHRHRDVVRESRSPTLSTSPPTTVLSSARSPSFITPYTHLDAHSFCRTVGLSAPHYTVGIWAADGQRIVYMYNDDEAKPVPIDTGIVILHMPGHTPDSLSWYDVYERLISVGDSLYEKESPDSRDEIGKRNWGPEPPMPTIFNNDSILLDWWASLKKVIDFVRERNEEAEEAEEEDAAVDEAKKDQEQSKEEEDDDDWILVEPYQFISPRQRDDRLSGPAQQTHRKPKAKRKPRLTLSAAHVTAAVDAAECLSDMQSFMARILRDEVPFKQLDELEGGKKVGFWDDCLDGERSRDLAGPGEVEGRRDEKKGRFSVRSPLWVIEEGRRMIPQKEWK